MLLIVSCTCYNWHHNICNLQAYNVDWVHIEFSQTHNFHLIPGDFFFLLGLIRRAGFLWEHAENISFLLFNSAKSGLKRIQKASLTHSWQTPVTGVKLLPLSISFHFISGSRPCLFSFLTCLLRDVWLVFSSSKVCLCTANLALNVTDVWPIYVAVFWVGSDTIAWHTMFSEKHCWSSGQCAFLSLVQLQVFI